MSLLYFSHADCLRHEMNDGHAERPDRLRAIEQHLQASSLAEQLDRRTPSPVSDQLLGAVHRGSYLDALVAMEPASGLVAVDPDTAMCPASLSAARLAAGAVVDAVEAVLPDPGARAFCAVRPPGHHAEADVAMGFCFYNSIALGAARALQESSIDRVAILDFDVHHGNGTVDIFKDTPEVLVCSSFQHPYYPHRYYDIERPNIVNTPLAAGTGGSEFRRRIEADWLPAIARHEPQLILVSAGFDAHRLDPLAGLALSEEDFYWVTQLIVAAATEHASGRIVSALEGGYDLNALAASVHAHLEALIA